MKKAIVRPQKSAVELLLERYEALLEENHQLKLSLEREKKTVQNYWSSIVWLRSSNAFKIKANPCPFCGSIHVGLEGSTCDAEWFVMCDCGAIGPSRDSERAAIHAWNKATGGTKYEDTEVETEPEAETEAEPAEVETL